MSKKKATVYGVGINDADYNVYKYNENKITWVCPFYEVWKAMLRRGYSKKYKSMNKTYSECTVCEDWLTFSNFKTWMETQKWEGLELDKDILSLGNKEYNPEVCVFVTHQVNSFVNDCGKSKGDFLIGVSWHKRDNKFTASCSNPFTKMGSHLGYFDCEMEAHKAWLAKKLEHAYTLAAIQPDPRVAKALIERYTNYKLQVGNNG